MELEYITHQILENIRVVSAVLLGILTIINIIIFVIPLQFKQARVKNGLSKLRIQLLEFGVILLSADLIGLYFFTRFFTRIFTSGLVISATTQNLLFTYALAHFLISAIGVKIYHQQYTEEHIEDSARNARFRIRHPNK